MSEDIVERLHYHSAAMHLCVNGTRVDDTPYARDWADKPHRVLYDALKLINSAADEIKRLRAQIARGDENYAKSLEYGGNLGDSAAALRAKLDTAVKALEPFANLEVWTESADDKDVCIMTVGTIRAARTALSSITDGQ